jgi:hypothetical protein
MHLHLSCTPIVALDHHPNGFESLQFFVQWLDVRPHVVLGGELGAGENCVLQHVGFVVPFDRIDVEDD